MQSMIALGMQRPLVVEVKSLQSDKGRRRLVELLRWEG